MRTAIFLTVLASLAGCRNIAGPCEAWHKPRADAPGLTIEEQERRARDKHTIPEDDFRIGPATGIDRPSPTGR
jgi:hypothetical protein